MWKLTNFSHVIRVEDGAVVPMSIGNADYGEYLAWLEAGNIAEPADLPPPRSPLEEIRAIEAPNDDDRKKLTRQFLIASLFQQAKDMAQAVPETASFTDQQIHDYLIAQGKGYAKLYAEEWAIIPFRELIP